MRHIVLARKFGKPRKSTGFTLVELLVAMVLLAVLLGSFSLLFSSAIRHSTDVQERVLLQTEARAAVDRLVRDLRQAYTGDASPPLETIGASAITFLSPDRAEPFHLRRIAYRVNGDKLERAMALSTDVDGPPWQFPALGTWAAQASGLVDSAVFAYRDKNGAATADPAAVHTVLVTLAVASRTSPARRLTYSTNVEVRATR